MTLQQKLADRLHGVTWHGDEYFSCECVFDTHEKPAMLVYGDGWYCLSCTRGGTLEYLEKNITKLPYKPSVHKSKILPRWTSWERRYGDIDGIVKAAHQNVLKGNDVFFKRRKLDEFIEKGQFGLLDGWIVIPVFDEHKVVRDIVVRAIRQDSVKYVVSIYNQNDSRPLYSPDWDRVKNSPNLFVTYGMFTVWSFEALSLPGVSGITGKSLNAELLDRFQKPIYIVPDRDEETAAFHLANGLGWRGKVLQIDWPDDCSDLDDIHRIYGNVALKEYLENAMKEITHATDNRVNMVSGQPGEFWAGSQGG